MQRRIAAHVLFLSALSQVIVRCRSQYLSDGFSSDVVPGMAIISGGLEMPRASVISLGIGGVADGPQPKRDYDGGIGISSFWTQGVYPVLVGRYGLGQGLGYSSELGPAYGRHGIGQGVVYGNDVGPSYGRYGVGQGVGYGNERGTSYSFGDGIAPGLSYAGGMEKGFGYRTGINAPGATAMGMDGTYAIESKYPSTNLGYGGPLSISNNGALGAGVTSYPIGGLSYAPVYPSMNVGSAVPFPHQRAALSANDNTNTNVNINNNMGKHRARLIGKGLLGISQA